MTRALWNTHGMAGDRLDQEEACTILGFSPEELTGLADYCALEVRVWGDVARARQGQARRKANLVAKYYRIRGRRFKELAAWAEQELAEWTDAARVAE